MKAGRQTVRFPLNIKTARLPGTTLDELEQAVVGADEPPAVDFDDDGGARPANPGINDAKKDSSRRKPGGIGRQQVSRRLGIAGRRIGEEVAARRCGGNAN